MKTKVIMFIKEKPEEEISGLNVKAVRKGIEAKYGMTFEDKAKASKQIKEYILEFFKKQADAEAAAAAKKPRKSKGPKSGRDEDEDAAAAKKGKSEGGSEQTCWVVTPNGVTAPKFLKKLQSSAMKTSTFLRNAGCVLL